MNARWAEETEDLVARAIGDPGSLLPRGDNGLESSPRWAMRTVLTALADADLLVPPGSEVWEEWAALDHGEIVTWMTEDNARSNVEWLRERDPDAKVMHRVKYTGPWQHVT